jgi:hypothetical protein
MVPIYLLRQLGAEVNWNPDTYSVGVRLWSQQEPQKSNETLLLEKAYKWLSDTDNAIWMFTVKLQQYANLDNPKDYLPVLDTEYQDLMKIYNESMSFALKINKIIQTDNKILDIISYQSKALDQIYQSKNLFNIWISQKTDAKVSTLFKISLLNSFQAAQQNILNTNKIIHSLLIQDIGIASTPN